MYKDFEKLVTWSLETYSSLPWRSEKRDLYRVLVSEIMLQQTTVATVLPRYQSFFDSFPTLADLAKANEEELVMAWKGLGYYRRAQNLYKAVKMIHELDGNFPETEEELLAVPGVGPYTAAALMAIGRDQASLAVDGNLQRVLSRFFLFSEEQGPKLQKRVWALMNDKKFVEMLKDLGPRKVNEALMDLGRGICGPRKIKCEQCPLSNSCLAFKHNKVNFYPVKKISSKLKVSELKLVRLLIKDEKGRFLFYKKNDNEWLKGQWELPTIVLGTEDREFKQYPLVSLNEFSQDQITTAITRYRIRNYWKVMDELDFRDLGIFKEREFAYYNWPQAEEHISTASEKILNFISEKII
jgi:A/G-specific adenine glycosylase